MASELKRYRKELAYLDPDDPQIAQKASTRAAKMKALLALNRRFYELSGLEGVKGEGKIDG